MPHKYRPKTLICEECGKEYVRIHPKRNRRFCSRRCAIIVTNRGRGERRVDLACLVCGAAFSSPQSMPAKYCSRACYNKGVANPFTCERCGQPSTRWRTGQRFCSKRCRGLSERKAISYITHQGYRVIYIDAQPVLEHRHVMEQMIGRKLLPI